MTESEVRWDYACTTTLPPPPLDPHSRQSLRLKGSRSCSHSPLQDDKGCERYSIRTRIRLLTIAILISFILLFRIQLGDNHLVVFQSSPVPSRHVCLAIGKSSLQIEYHKTHNLPIRRRPCALPTSIPLAAVESSRIEAAAPVSR